MKRRQQADDISELKSKVAKQAQTIEFLLKRVANLTVLLQEARESGSWARRNG